MDKKYNVITLCGSTRFKKEFLELQEKLTLEGNIVISVGVFRHADNIDINAATKAMLDDIHKRKIDMADEIFVIDVDGYIGKSTKSEIEYAKAQKKKVVYLIHPLIGKEICFRRENTHHIIKEVIEFDEDTFGQGDFAVITEDGQYFYECEIDFLNQKQIVTHRKNAVLKGDAKYEEDINYQRFPCMWKNIFV